MNGRDLFIQGLPSYLKKKTLDQIRIMSREKGNFKFVRDQLQESSPKRKMKRRGWNDERIMVQTMGRQIMPERRFSLENVKIRRKTRRKPYQRVCYVCKP